MNHRRRAVALSVVAFVALATGSAAQDTFFSAPRIDDVFVGADGFLRVQCGSQVRLFDPAARAPAGPTSAFVLPADAVLYDHDRALVVVAPQGAFLDGTLRRGEGLRAPAEVSGPPFRAPLLLAGGRFAAPDSRGVAVVDPADAARPAPYFPVVRLRRESFGLAGRVAASTVWPHVFALGTAKDAPLLVGGAGRFFVRSDAGVETPLPPLELDDASTVQGFPTAVAPFLFFASAEAPPALVRIDPARGLLAFQGGLGAATPPPPSVRLFGGPCLAAAPCRTPDGAPGLFVLTTPVPTPARQLTALVTKSISVSALVYRTTAEGPGASPVFRVDRDLPVAFRIRDGERDARVAALIGMRPDGALVVAEAGKPVRLFSARAGGVHETALGATPEGEWVDPWRPIAAGARLFGVLRTATEDRLIVF